MEIIPGPLQENLFLDNLVTVLRIVIGFLEQGIGLLVGTVVVVDILDKVGIEGDNPVRHDQTGVPQDGGLLVHDQGGIPHGKGRQ